MKPVELSEESKRLLERQTGIEYDKLVSNTIDESMKECKKQKTVRGIQEQTTRNIYIELGRMLSMKKINRYLKGL